MYSTPNPIVDVKEERLLQTLTEKYEKLTTPSDLAVAGKTLKKAIVKATPDKIKLAGIALSDSVTEADIYKQALDLLANGFTKIEELAASYTISKTAIVVRVNLATPNNEIKRIEDCCLARSYDIQRLVNTYRKKDMGLALIEGAGTGFAGFWGIPFNLVFSTFLYYRAVQAVAMFYGYNVIDDPNELVIASEVFSCAMSPLQKGSQSELGSIVVKVLALSETATVKKLVTKNWTDMATHGGLALLITQIRALSNVYARRALENTGKKGLENSLFKNFFGQLGSKFTQQTVKKAMPFVSSFIGACMDTAQMSKIIEYADIFYHKRFIIEKEVRIYELQGNMNTIASFENIETI